MNLKTAIFSILIFTSICSCSQSESDSINSTNSNELYFPPLTSTQWETISPDALDWNTSTEQDLYDYLNTTHTKAFIILKNGKIVVEWYMNNFTQEDIWYWASAGKTLTALTLGIAQEEGFLNLEDTSAEYLGNNWSMLTASQEANIKVSHHLTMTTGLDFNSSYGTFCTDPTCLLYLHEPGTYWYYHNAPYTLLDHIITGAVGQDFENYFQDKVANKIGMSGFWLQNGYNNIYRSDARSMARFGLLCLNKGKWDTKTIITDIDYFNAMTTTSQELNKSYGYLWWLNGKTSYKLPSSTETFIGSLIPNAPNDLIAGLGANDQKLYIIPSKNIVIIRMGNNGGEGQLGPSGYDNNLWEKIGNYIN